MSNKELRSFSFEVRAENDEKHGNMLTGRPIVYNQRTNLGICDEIIDQGALDGADLRDVCFFVNHKLDMLPLARSRNNNENSTMQMSIDKDGMAIRVDLDTENNAEAKALYSSVQRGDVSGMSFAFTVKEDAWENLDTDHPLRHIRSFDRIFEVSAVVFPAYEATSISCRGLDEALENAKSALENERRKADAEAQKERIKSLLEETYEL